MRPLPSTHPTPILAAHQLPQTTHRPSEAPAFQGQARPLPASHGAKAALETESLAPSEEALQDASHRHVVLPCPSAFRSPLPSTGICSPLPSLQTLSCSSHSALVPQVWLGAQVLHKPRGQEERGSETLRPQGSLSAPCLPGLRAAWKQQVQQYMVWPSGVCSITGPPGTSQQSGRSR